MLRLTIRKIFGSGYCSLEEAKNFLILNDIPESKIKICNPQYKKLPMFKFDLLVSFLSMGFHCPCDDYVDFILANHKPNSILIFDKTSKKMQSIKDMTCF